MDLNLASALIALAALVATLTTMVRDRKGRALAVTPHLSIDTHADEDAGVFELLIRNAGVGPAIVDSFEFYADGALTHKAGAPTRNSIEQMLIGIGLDEHQCVWGYPTPGTFIAAGESICFLRVSRPESNGKEVIRACKRLELRVKYHSLYRKKFEDTSVQSG
jgi:hypothetical protein